MPKKVDANHPAIVAALRQAGASVQSLAALGKGCPDVLVAYRGQWFVAEIKDGSKAPSRRVLTDAEQDWHATFGHKAPVHIWESIDDALQAIGAVH